MSLKRENDRIIFDSDAQKERLANDLLVGNDDFMLDMFRIIGKVRKRQTRIWKWLEEELKGQLEPDESLVYRHDIDELCVVKTTHITYPEREGQEL